MQDGWKEALKALWRRPSMQYPCVAAMQNVRPLPKRVSFVQDLSRIDEQVLTGTCQPQPSSSKFE
jgi:hypothetical protein